MFYSQVLEKRGVIFVRGVDDNGKRFIKKEKYKPYLFAYSKEETEYKDINGNFMKKISFPSISTFKNFLYQSRNVDGARIYGVRDVACQYISETFKGVIHFDRAQLKTFNIDIEVDSGIGFPEPSEARMAITAITIKDSSNNRFYCWGCKEYNNTRDDVVYRQCRNEREMIELFLTFWERMNPDIITGWNINTFDIPYIVNRVNRLNDENPNAKQIDIWRLSPLGEVVVKEIKSDIRDIQGYDILGVTILDYMELYKKFTYSARESYALNFIASEELGEEKIAYTGTLGDLYQDDYQKFIDYNIQDVNLVSMLDDKLKLIDLAMELAFIAKVPNINMVYGSVRFWELLIYNSLLEKNIIVFDGKNQNNNRDKQYKGAFVKVPQIGRHQWVVSYDLTSMYPSIIIEFNISPETIMNKLNNMPGVKDLIKGQEIDTSIWGGDYSTAANGCQYTKQKDGFLPILMRSLFDARSAYKKEMKKAEIEKEAVDNKLKENPTPELKEDFERLVKKVTAFNNKQTAFKICLNSAYGALGNAYFQYYNINNAEAITITGQVIIKWLELRINKHINKLVETTDVDYCLASDTDSLYISFEKLIAKNFTEEQQKDKAMITEWLDQFSKREIEPMLDKWFKDIHTFLGSYTPFLNMKRENIGDVAIWTAKKRYMMNIYDKEGVRLKKPKLKIMGIECVRASTPKVCREKIREAIRLILQSDNEHLIDFIEDFKKEFRTLPVHTIAFPRGISDLTKYDVEEDENFKPHTPMHVRAGIVFNHLLKKHNLKKIKPIGNGDKIKYCYLKEQNPIQEKTIGFTTELPVKFGLHDYIDYDMQFQKAFLDPIETILEVIDWKSGRPTDTSEDMFFF